MREERYREAERRLWADAGANPTEHRIHLAHNDVTVRIQEVGQGPPALFIHGGPGAAGAVWAYVAARLSGLRCLLLDRPGTGLSERSPLTCPADVMEESRTLVTDVLDAFNLEWAHLVGSSHGSHIALLTAAEHPDRVGRTVHFGCPGFIDGMNVTAADRLVLLPGMRHLFALARPSEKSFLKVLRQLGHGTMLDNGGVSPALLAWALALQTETGTMRNEFQSMSAMGTFRGGFAESLTIGPDRLSAIRSPSSFLWGENDVYGNAAVARRAVEAMPDASLEILPEAGHLCWLDDLERAVTVVGRHLLGADTPTASSTE